MISYTRELDVFFEHFQLHLAGKLLKLSTLFAILLSAKQEAHHMYINQNDTHSDGL